KCMLDAVATARGDSDVRTWLGPLSDLGGGPPERAIADHLGLFPRDGPVELAWLVPLEPADAKSALTFFATSSMVHPWSGKAPDSALVSALEAGFRAMGSEVCCYSNGDWHLNSGSFGWRPLTNATFDGGVIGHNGDAGFALWVEEED